LVYWLPRAWSFRKNIKLELDVRGTLRQIRHLSTLDTALVPHPHRNLRLTSRPF